MAEPKQHSNPVSGGNIDLSMRGGGSRPGMPMTKVKPKNTMRTIRRLWGYIRSYQSGLIAVILFTIITTLLSLVAPYLLGTAVDHYIIPGDFQGLLGLCVVLLAVYAGTALTAWLQQQVMVKVAQHTVQSMRRDIFARLQLLPLRFFDSKTYGELMSRTTNDIENVSGTLNQSVTQLIASALSLIGSLAIMLYLNVWLTLLSMVTIPLVMLFTKTVTTRTRKYFSNQQASLGELNSLIEETVSGQKVVQVYRREQKAAEQFDEINHKLTNASIQAQIYSGTMGPVMNVLNNLSFALIAAVGGWMAFNEWTTVGVIVAFLNYSKQFQRPLSDLANQFNLLQSAVAGAERVFETIDTKTEYEDEAHSRSIEEVRGEVRFDRVSFSYKNGVPILSEVSLTASPGQTIALVGPTGAGKTTIINLLTRFYEIDSGIVTIDGVDIRQLDKNSLRSKLGIVLQDAYVFSDTIRENIRYGRLDATDEEIEAAARLANAHTFIQKLPDGYDTMLMSGGGNLSQGQRQLLTIARAVLADPAILILDEATSSIDTRTEMHIQTAMRKLMKGRTSFVIAHRLSTIREADQILVINQGGIIERGTHDELLEERGFYYELYNSQFKRSS
ncbi:ABC transporter ATP-binding protein [Brevibacillus invocatus]|uniref:ABC transporter ATP-binding protein n=1 Tax=Brevibacillus invocatus TaxID=173959 RepID=UPI00203AAF5E|nr:ABC transporter ATP-binding protein [Brevibacillus invocatus]MCM3082040.1 ABC transporter ATP-binding protein/permease [Brevibacillus invocatus]MCM3432451.1 ABC transporter ATP-binding protein/permease [Brevibacillus invocatus]